MKATFGQSTGTRSAFSFSSVEPTRIGRFLGKKFIMDVKAPRGVSVVIDDREPYFVRPGDRIVMHAVDVDGATVLVFVEAPATRNEGVKERQLPVGRLAVRP